MECAHCGSDFETTPHTFSLGIDQDGTWQVTSTRCPTCDRLVVGICSKEGTSYPAYPAASLRARLSADVPADLASEYWTAAQILPYSEEASAAISRRLLQRVLSGQAGAGYGGLAEQIRRAISSSAMPPYLKEALETLAVVAGLEDDEPKSYRCDSLAPVKEGEAEWLLDVLKPLFEFYYVQPARLRRKRYAMEERIGPRFTAAELEDAESETNGWTVIAGAPADPAAPTEPVKEPVQ